MSRELALEVLCGNKICNTITHNSECGLHFLNEGNEHFSLLCSLPPWALAEVQKHNPG